MISPIVEERENVPAPTASVSVDGTGESGDVAITSAGRRPADSPVLRSDGYDVDEGTILLDPITVGLDEEDSDVDGQSATVRLGDENLDLTIETFLRTSPRGRPWSAVPTRRPSRRPGDSAAEQTGRRSPMTHRARRSRP